MAKASMDSKSVLVSVLEKSPFVVNGLEFLKLSNVGDGNGLITIPCTNGDITVVNVEKRILEIFASNKETAFKVLKKVKSATLNYVGGGDSFSILFPLKSIHQVAKIAIAARKPGH